MEPSKDGKLEVIWYLWREGMTGSQILREMLEMFGHTCLSKATIYRWIERFENGDEDSHDAPHPSRPTSSKIRTNIEAVQRILEEYRRITLRALEERVGMSIFRLFTKTWKCQRFLHVGIQNFFQKNKSVIGSRSVRNYCQCQGRQGVFGSHNYG